MLDKAGDGVDSFRETDCLRVVGDSIMIRQSQDTFGTFARSGKAVGEKALATLSDDCEGAHATMVREFNEFVAELFVARVHAHSRQGHLTARVRQRSPACE